MATIRALLMVVFLTLTCKAQQQPSVDDCKKLADLYFLIDGSDSMSTENFRKQLEFVTNVVGGLMLSPTDGFKVGVIVFSRDIQEIPLGAITNKQELSTKLNNLTHDRDGTYTHLAIEKMTTSFRVTANRGGVQRIAILLTDGLSKFPEETRRAAQRAKENFNVQLIAVGIGSQVNSKELNDIASRSDLAITVPNFNALTALALQIATTVCPETTTTSTTTTTTTTTTTPPPTTTTPKSSPCDNCAFRNGVGYQKHEYDCNLFYHCYDDGYGLYPVLKQCGFGLFWDQTTLTCLRPGSVPGCTQQLCPYGARKLPYSNNCRAYWTCYDNKPINADCCPEFHAYVEDVGCVPNSACTDPCPGEKPANPGVCNRRVGPQEHLYYEDLDNYETLLRSCAPGSAFDDVTCYCSKFTYVPHTPPSNACSPALYIPFDVDVTDQSGRKVYVGNTGVTIAKDIPGTIGGGVGYFDGNAFLTLWRFANVDFRSEFILSFRYQESASSYSQGKEEAILSNSGCNDPCSIAVSFDRALGETVAAVRTTESGEVTARVRNTRTGWKQVQYTYNGQHLVLEVDGEVKQVVAAGDIQRVPAAIEIGAGCDRYDKFTGYIDELFLYQCLA